MQDRCQKYYTLNIRITNKKYNKILVRTKFLVKKINSPSSLVKSFLIISVAFERLKDVQINL